VLSRLAKAEQQLAQAPPVDGPVGGVELRAYQLQMLGKLRAIRATLEAEGASVATLTQERDDARAERDALAKQVAKLNYRVEHLKKHVHV
jgi:hypothetical protein